MNGAPRRKTRAIVTQENIPNWGRSSPDDSVIIVRETATEILPRAPSVNICHSLLQISESEKRLGQ